MVTDCGTQAQLVEAVYNSKTVVLGQLIFNIITTRWILLAKLTECSSRSKVPSSTIEDTAVDLATVIR